ncbi:MAG: hypothetical protein ABL962_13255, partial [Fimbriimonadaceae bacterium]
SRCLPVLIRAARVEKTISYARLGKEIGHPAHLLDQALAQVRNDCLKRGWPPLTILVLDGCTGLPLSEPRDELSDEEYSALAQRLKQEVFAFEGWPS